MTFEKMEAEITSYMESTRLFFAFLSLNNFAQNGRVPKVVASALGTLGISILGTASPNGTVEPTGKCRGEKKICKKLLEDMEKAGYHGGRIRLCHIENPLLAGMLSDFIQQKYPQAQVMVYPARGLCSYYGEQGGIILGCET